MKLRRSIALLFCTLYLLATGCMAMASMHCHCHHEEPCHHHDFHIEAGCCGNHHEVVELSLYTVDEESALRRLMRPIVSFMPVVKGEMLLPKLDELPSETLLYADYTPPVHHAVVTLGSLRAPPVTR